MNTNTPNSWLNKTIDSFASLIILILLFPLLLLLVVLIMLESKGPVFCYSYRVGMNYHIFKFYKFRTMYTEDYLLKNQHNHINANQKRIVASEVIEPLSRELLLSLNSDKIRIKDTGFVDESKYESMKKDLNPQEINNLTNDPRLTRIGRWIQNMNLHELPQLFNILKGDISLIGDRPLPINEAERLVSDELIDHLIRPIGFIRFWNVTGSDKKERHVLKSSKFGNRIFQEYVFLQYLNILPRASFYVVPLSRKFDSDES
jgi:lipopolysaccharide/colanic/teichoic acid biosynthesis glycosyltransferase